LPRVRPPRLPTKPEFDLALILAHWAWRDGDAKRPGALLIVICCLGRPCPYAHPGATGIAADDRKRGMAMFRSEQSDLVIIDIVMPEQEGMQTIAEITEGAALEAKIIAFSGSGASATPTFSIWRDLSAPWTSSRSPSMRTTLDHRGELPRRPRCRRQRRACGVTIRALT
jgi:response regulator receiver domain-containing protein